ncbi:hypothetical protein GGR55DRAFT_666481 [Xylaria sp. FL0064]|nr:hypothetical protein GGR55DRAFT_666481 [Xylaria sp. FL0064]
MDRRTDGRIIPCHSYRQEQIALRSHSKFSQSTIDMSRNRCLIVLIHGNYGLALNATKPGGVCAIIYGTSWPFILREVNGRQHHYTIVGPAHFLFHVAVELIPRRQVIVWLKLHCAMMSFQGRSLIEPIQTSPGSYSSAYILARVLVCAYIVEPADIGVFGYDVLAQISSIQRTPKRILARYYMLSFYLEISV